MHPQTPPIRRPKFRLLAATIMLGSIVAGATMALLAAWVFLRDTPVDVARAAPESRGAFALGWAFLSQQSFVTLIGAAAAMWLLALILRAIVLEGLRD